MKTLDSLTKEDKVACIKNWVEELHQDATGVETTRKLLDEYRKSNNELITQLEDEKVLTNHLHKENIFFRNSVDTLTREIEKLKTSKSLSEEEINKLVNDKITSIFRNPLTYLMNLPVTERNELIGRIYTAIIGVRFT